ncbi:MAG: hypothetical protein OEX07_09460 [Gammaproteobacteria bacterium]|nr:hypothetical protein [Gammaproteobacteria bacterium]
MKGDLIQTELFSIILFRKRCFQFLIFPVVRFFSIALFSFFYFLRSFFSISIFTSLFSFLFFLFTFTVSAEESNRVWIPGWQLTSEMNIARAGAAVVSHNNRIYIIGGVDGVNFLSTVESAAISPDGSLSSWRTISKMPEARGFMSATVFDGRIYVVGGGNGPYGKHLLNSVVSASILNNGEIGEWRTESEKMLMPRRCAKLIVKDDQLHVLGGFGGALLDSVESASFLKAGGLSSWKMQVNQMTMPRYVNEVKRIENYAVVIGGHHPTKGAGINAVEYANLNEANLTWRSGPSMYTGRYAFASATHEKYLYAFGGISGTEYLNSTEKLFVNDEIESNKWSISSKLPAFMANFTTLVVGDHVYLVGGSTRHEYLPKVWVATFNSSGDIGFYGTTHDLDVFKASAPAVKEETLLPNSGIVLESIATDGYTYIRVLSDAKEIWLASPEITVLPDSLIRFSEGVYMSNFRSKALNRDFEAILFVGTVVLE